MLLKSWLQGEVGEKQNNEEEESEEKIGQNVLSTRFNVMIPLHELLIK